MKKAIVNAALFKYLGGRAPIGSTVAIVEDSGKVYATNADGLNERLEVVDVREAAKLLHMGTASVYRAIESGNLDAVQCLPGKMLVFKWSIPGQDDRPAMTVREAAQLLGVKPARVYQMINDGTLEGVKQFARKTKVVSASVEQIRQKKLARMGITD